MSDKVTIAHPVQVKVVMTSAFREELRSEVQTSIQQLQENLDRLDGVQPAEGEAAPWLEAERARLRRLKGELEWRLREAEQVKEGAELPTTTYQGLVEVAVGDHFRSKLASEVVLKDGVVVAI
ncbi:MAG: YlqD family protein, partial [Candidatus Eremiobacterota bacterium]